MVLNQVYVIIVENGERTVERKSDGLPIDGAEIEDIDVSLHPLNGTILVPDGDGKMHKFRSVPVQFRKR